MRRTLAPLLILIAAAAGCTERRLSITSDPPGATVTVNDTEVGRTPVEASFVYYGDFDILIEHEGYEPLRTRAEVSAPLYERPPFDIFTLLWPWDIHTNIPLHYKLQPELSTVQSKQELEKGILDRAATLRGQINP